MIKGKSFHTPTDNSMTQIRNTLQFEVIVSWLIHDSVASLFSIFFLPMHLWLCPVVNGSQWDQPHWIVNLRTWVCALALCIRKRIFFPSPWHNYSAKLQCNSFVWDVSMPSVSICIACICGNQCDIQRRETSSDCYDQGPWTHGNCLFPQEKRVRENRNLAFSWKSRPSWACHNSLRNLSPTDHTRWWLWREEGEVIISHFKTS